MPTCRTHYLPVYRVYHRLPTFTDTVTLFERHVYPACKPFTFSTHIIILLYHPLSDMLCSITPFGFWFHADLGYVELGIYQLSKSHIRFGMDPRFDSAIRGSYRSFYHVLPTVLTFHSITFWFCISKNRKVGRITDGIAISVNVRYLFNVTQFIWNNNLCPNYLFTAVLAFHLITIASKAP